MTDRPAHVPVMLAADAAPDAIVALVTAALVGHDARRTGRDPRGTGPGRTGRTGHDPRGTGRTGYDARGPLVLGVDGRSGSGKSDLARDITARLRGVDGLTGPGAVALFTLEDVYRGWDGLAVGVGLAAAGVLEPLSRGLPGAVHRYDWSARAVAEELRIPAAGDELPRVLVVEGCGAGSRLCEPFVGLLVWLEAPAEARRARAMARDGGTWADRWDAWAAQERALLRVRDAHAVADVVVRTG
ncbi:MAG: nucleoside/nucleotide kinase family protein [Georgenia sp.]